VINHFESRIKNTIVASMSDNLLTIDNTQKIETMEEKEAADDVITQIDSELDAVVSPPWFNFEGEMMRAKVVDVYDGDTITLVFRFGNKIWKDKCRLSGIDTPEIRTRDADEKIRGFAARGLVRAHLFKKKSWIRCGKWDKYGRLLGTIFLSSDCINSINQELIENGFAVPYLV